MPELREGARGKAVRTLQQALSDKGYSPGAIDGSFGPRTHKAVVEFQRTEGLPADGVAGQQTWGVLGVTKPRASGGRLNGSLATLGDVAGRSRSSRPAVSQGLQQAVHGNPYTNSVHNCFRYAWHLVQSIGGSGVDSAAEARSHRNQPLGHLGLMEANGSLKPGMVVYVNRRPGADPSSTELRYGPHWFTYLGNGRFRDQYGTKTLSQMEAFVPGRRIDTIYDPFA